MLQTHQASGSLTSANPARNCTACKASKTRVGAKSLSREENLSKLMVSSVISFDLHAGDAFEEIQNASGLKTTLVFCSEMYHVLTYAVSGEIDRGSETTQYHMSGMYTESRASGWEQLILILRHRQDDFPTTLVQ